MYRINEIFYTLQGEGYFAGCPAAFVRFSGCNLKCPFCDTKFDTYKEMSAEEIIREIQNLIHGGNSGNKDNNGNEPIIVLTGGEPTLQADKQLIDALHKERYFITIETNGTNPIPEGIDWVTYSPKEQTAVAAPSSPYAASGKQVHVNELKIVYLGQDVEKYYKSIKAEHYFLQPCSNKNTKEVVAYILEHPHWWLSLQAHKIINIK